MYTTRSIMPAKKRKGILAQPSFDGLRDFFAFRNLVTPKIIQTVFWLGSAFSVVAGLTTMVLGLTGDGIVMMLVGLLMLALGPIGIRVFCELIMLVFKIAEILTQAQERSNRDATTPA